MMSSLSTKPNQSFILVTVILLSYGLYDSAEACSPANRAAIKQLKELLGISFVNKTINPENTDYDPDNFIDKPSDLNCDFSDPSQCQWTNYIPANTTRDPLDVVDYYQFNATEKGKNWNRNHLRPGAPPAIGDSFLLIGDKEARPNSPKTKPSGGVLLSSPVICQKAGGTLSFKYIFYKAAKIEIRVLRPGREPLVPIPGVDLPAHDCTSSAPRNYRCQVKLPAINEPFQLGIRSYNFANDAFAMIDDIEYDAEFCTNPYDGLGAGERALGEGEGAGGLTGDRIKNEKELRCGTSGSDDCRWGNLDGNDAEWKVGTEKPPNPGKWESMTGTSEMPNPPYLMVTYGKTGGAEDDNPQAVLLSDPMRCQNGDGKLSFKYWMTAGTFLKACALKAGSKEEIKCAFVERQDSPGPAEVTIDGPIKEEFVLAIIAEEFNLGEGGFVAIDDVNYKADICDPFPPNHGACRSLTCNMERGNMCRYKTTRSETFGPKFRVGRGKLPGLTPTTSVAKGYKGKYMGTVIKQTGVKRPGGKTFWSSSMATIHSPPLKLKQDAKLAFKYQLGTAGSVMYYCLNSFSPYKRVDTQKSNCKKLSSKVTKSPQTAEIKLSKATKRMFIVAQHRKFKNGDGGFMVDDLTLVNMDGSKIC